MEKTPQGEFENLARSATRCRECFDRGEVQAPYITVAQPRWVGPNYWASSFRIAVVTINPGDSKETPQAVDYLPRIRSFRDGSSNLSSILESQRETMKLWGKSPGRFTDFYFGGVGLDVDETAFANVAWCGTSGNQPPRTMLDRCFDRHTSRLLEILQPDVVLLSGSKIHRFGRRISALGIRSVIKMLHYAHREGAAADEREFARVRSLLATARAQAGR